MGSSGGQRIARRTRPGGGPAATTGTTGARVRELRTAAGLTQAELAGHRFSKEYVSQVELGKTRPSPAALEWFASRLRTDVGALTGRAEENVVLACRAAAALAEAQMEAHRYADATASLESVSAPAGEDPDAVRAGVAVGLARGWALHHVGRLEESLTALDAARVAAASLGGGEGEVALALYRMGVVRFKMGSLSTALALLEEALRAAEAARVPSDALRVRVFNARAKVRRRQKDFVAASEDVALALELARSLGDPRVLAETYLDASNVAARQQEFERARDYAERSRALFEMVADNEYVGKLLNNLGHLRVLTGQPREAVDLLRESFRIAVEVDNRIDAAFAASSLASAHLNAGDFDAAVTSAERALELLDERPEYRQEIGTAHLVAGRAHLAQGRLVLAEEMFRAAAECYAAVGAISHLAGAWMALGDVAAARGDSTAAAELFRRAAEALQDVRW